MFRKKRVLTRQVWNEIRATIGRHPAETGGILGSGDGGRTIDHFYFDRSAHTTGSTYKPDTAAINRVIREWNDQGVQFIGFIHSHPRGHTVPSSEDIRYAKRIMEALA